MKSSYFLLPILVIFTTGFVNAQDVITAYVWDFSDREGGTSNLTTSFTQEFEEKLQQSECCQILQRRYYSRLFKHKQNEKSIQGIGNISSDAESKLRDIEANTVVFGEIYDDTSSGKVKLSVTFESFSGIILKSGSVYLAKYEISDPEKRESAIENLLDELKLPSGSRKGIVVTETVNEWTFSLTGCERLNKDVKCGIVVTSNYRDRHFSINPNTRAFDEYGYEYICGTKKLANKMGEPHRHLQTTLIDGIATSGFIMFENVSSRANQFKLLELQVGGDDMSVEEKIQFRDVDIK